MRNFTETREKAIKRTRQLVCYFAEFMLEEEEKGAKQRAEFEKAKAEGKPVIMVSCAENNIRCMHNCMKAASEVVKFLSDKENEVEEWQLAAINAMYETCNTTKVQQNQEKQGLAGAMNEPEAGADESQAAADDETVDIPEATAILTADLFNLRAYISEDDFYNLQEIVINCELAARKGGEE